MLWQQRALVWRRTMPGSHPNPIAVFGSFALALWLVLATPLFALIALMIAPLPPKKRYAIIALWSAGTIFFARVFCGIRYRVIGRENIPNVPCIFFSRHESTWETLAFQSILPPQAIVLRRSLLSIPFFGWGLRQMSPIAIDRQRGTAALRLMLRQGRARLREGFCTTKLMASLFRRQNWRNRAISAMRSRKHQPQRHRKRAENGNRIRMAAGHCAPPNQCALLPRIRIERYGTDALLHQPTGKLRKGRMAPARKCRHIYQRTRQARNARAIISLNRRVAFVKSIGN